MLVLSDTLVTFRTLEQAQLAKDAGIHIFVTIVGNWYDEQVDIDFISILNTIALFIMKVSHSNFHSGIE